MSADASQATHPHFPTDMVHSILSMRLEPAAGTALPRVNGLDFVCGRFANWTILIWCAVNLLHLFLNQIPLIFLHESIGYGDSYIFHTLEDFRRTGVLYPPLGPDHLTPVLYSPLLYLMHLVAWMAAPTGLNPYFGPRILELFWFGACVTASGALARRIIPARNAFWLGAMLAASCSLTIPWVLQMRSDFPGIACSLLAVWFLLSRNGDHSLAAGVCAGLALEFKITFIAAAAAGCLWLLLSKRWRELIRFALATAVSSLGIYALFSLREPKMPGQILMMSKMIAHPAGVLTFFRQLSGEPACLLAVAGLLSIAGPLVRRRCDRLRLILLFIAISFATATFSSIQAGASINYFYEALFAATPFGVWAFLRLQARSAPVAGLLAGLLLLLTTVLPATARMLRATKTTFSEISLRNHDYEALRNALRGTRIVSSIPDVTILTPESIITDPYLLSYLLITRGSDISPLIDRVNRQYFDTVVTLPADYSWRGLPQLTPQLRSSIVASYAPYCMFHAMLFHLPQDRPESPLAARLRGIGCEVVPCGPGLKCPGLGVKVEAFQ